MSDRLRQSPLAVGVAYLAFGGYILGRFANSAFPTFYLRRRSQTDQPASTPTPT